MTGKPVAPPAPQLYGTANRTGPPMLGKFWGFRCGTWRRVKVTSLPLHGGTGGLVYAPVDRRGYPHTNGAALQDCQALWGPVAVWGERPPRITKAMLRQVGVSESWLSRKR